MAKRKPTGATLAAQRILGTERNRLDSLPKDRSVVIGIRIPPAMKARLLAHFRAKGTDLSTGLRQLIARYLNEEGLG